MFIRRAAVGVFFRRVEGRSSAELLECSSVKLLDCAFVEFLTVIPGEL